MNGTWYGPVLVTTTASIRIHQARPNNTPADVEVTFLRVEASQSAQQPWQWEGKEGGRRLKNGHGTDRADRRLGVGSGNRAADKEGGERAKRWRKEPERQRAERECEVGSIAGEGRDGGCGEGSGAEVQSGH